MPVAVSNPDFYAVLELEKGATEDDIRVAYKKLALKWHPDRHQEHKDEAQEKFVEVQDAYLHLLEEFRRCNKRKTRKTKSQSSKSSASSAHTASSTGSAPSMNTASTASSTSAASSESTSEKPRHGVHKHRERRTKEGSNRPPDSPPSVSAKKPRKLSKHAPQRSDRHANFSHRSEHDDSSEDESFTSKKPRRSKSGGSLGDTDYEFVEFADLGTPLPPLRSPKPRSNDSPDEKDWIFPLPLTLEELYHGASQNYRITRILRSGRTQCVKINLSISPSWRDGSRIRIPGVGNEQEDGTFQDIVFVVEEQPHGCYTRVDNDLHVSVQVPWADGPSRPYSSSSAESEDDAEAFGDEAVYVKALNGREYAIPIPHSLVEAADGSRIVGAGMPIRKHGKILGKGDLIIKWEFAFTDADKGQRLRWQNLRKAMHWRL